MSDKDTIYRQDAIDAIHTYQTSNDLYYREGHEIMTVDYVEKILSALPSAQPEPKSRQQFEKSLYDMFDHIWDAEIDHPVFQDTVGELMDAVLLAFDNAQPEIIRCKNCIHLGHAYMMPCKNCRRNQTLPDWYEEETEGREDAQQRR